MEDFLDSQTRWVYRVGANKEKFVSTLVWTVIAALVSASLAVVFFLFSCEFFGNECKGEDECSITFAGMGLMSFCGMVFFLRLAYMEVIIQCSSI